MKISILPWMGAIALVVLLLSSCSQSTAKTASLTVSSAASLKEAMADIKQLYTQQKPNVSITYNFGASGSLQQQIEQGAPVDIFISAAPKQMDALQSKGLLVADTRKNLLTNKLVLIAPKNSSIVFGFNDLTSDRVAKIAIGEAKSVPAGKYAEEVLTSLKIFEQIKPKLVFAKDVRQVLSYVETGNADAGIVYLTDAKLSKSVKIVATASANYHSPVVYPVAVLKDSKNLDTAKEFVQFLSSEPAINVYEKYGFSQAASD